MVGLIATAGGEQAATHATEAMVHTVHALRGIVAPLMVTVPKTWKISDKDGNITDDDYGGRLDRLGELVADLADRLSPEDRTRHAEPAGVAG